MLHETGEWNFGGWIGSTAHNRRQVRLVISEWCSDRPGMRGAQRQLRVLVVDDGHDGTDVLTQLVASWGHDACSAYDASSALEIASVVRPDVVLLELTIGDMEGHRMARRLRSEPRYRDTLLVAITGLAGPQHWLACRDAGIDVYLIKPVAPDVLNELLAARRRWLASAPRLAWPQVSADAFGTGAAQRSR
jgi:CheY-like chemotaxis protein